MSTPFSPGPQGQPAYQTGGLPGAPTPPPPAAPAERRNTPAIVALVLAVLGLIFAVTEGAYILGWILLPAAFVVSIVALVVRDKPRKMAVAALIVSIVGTVAGGVAFLTSTARILDESFGGGEASVVATPDAPESQAAAEVEAGDPSAEATESAAAEEPQAETSAGTRDNPHHLGTTVASDDWEVTVNSFTADATDEVMAENQFNEEPADGTTYALVNVTVTRRGAESGIPWEVTVAYVTESGNVVNSSDSFAVGPDELPSNELYEGASATGNVVLAIPADGSGTVRVTPGLFADDVFFATS